MCSCVVNTNPSATESETQDPDDGHGNDTVGTMQAEATNYYETLNAHTNKMYVIANSPGNQRQHLQNTTQQQLNVIYETCSDTPARAHASKQVNSVSGYVNVSTQQQVNGVSGYVNVSAQQQVADGDAYEMTTCEAYGLKTTSEQITSSDPKDYELPVTRPVQEIAQGTVHQSEAAAQNAGDITPEDYELPVIHPKVHETSAQNESSTTKGCSDTNAVHAEETQDTV